MNGVDNKALWGHVGQNWLGKNSWQNPDRYYAETWKMIKISEEGKCGI